MTKRGSVDNENNIRRPFLVITKKCHRIITDERRREIDKTRRISEKNAGVRKRKGRPMPGTRASGIRKRFDGTVERW